MNLNDWTNECYEMAERKGFHGQRSRFGRDDTLIRLCLIHTEVSEASQIVKRHGTDMDSGKLAEEISDVLIRVFDLAGCLGIDLEKGVAKKLATNDKRPHLYGTPFAGKPSIEEGTK